MADETKNTTSSLGQFAAKVLSEEKITTRNSNPYGTMDGQPQIRNINRIDQRIINDFHASSAPYAKEVRNKDMFAVMDELVYRTRTATTLKDFSIFSLDKWDKRCEDAVDKAIETGQTQEKLRGALEYGCFATTHRNNRSEIMNTYEEDRKEILEQKFGLKL